ncbi:MAG: NAD(P)H-dependent oxidoreductase [Ilumatobacter sp.]|uniref:NAD(P)H-dependent oxidoreductase n=1 Tax=Ilumatobacter sp. TaxID=1967498 RepID=UPI00261FE738|nr:NAD(P)H-dependent oxidoreductase [Ilumatobacter sp.]MDJ0768249.1 NAD(P)H-dependent oxidoreductase [Ilumatobacter sp.]
MRVLVVYCHPNPESLIAAALDRTLRALARGGHEVRVDDLYASGFRPEMSADERRGHKEPGVDAGLQPFADRLHWAEALVLVYPTWWSGQPAMLKGWIDRVWIAGVAWTGNGRNGRPRPLLTNIRRIVVVTTHGSTKLLNSLEGEAGKRTVTRSIRPMCSRRARTTWCALYGVDQSDEAKRTGFLDRVERTLAKL